MIQIENYVIKYSEIDINIFDHLPRGPVAWPSCLSKFIWPLPDLWHTKCVIVATMLPAGELAGCFLVLFKKIYRLFQGESDGVIMSTIWIFIVFSTSALSSFVQWPFWISRCNRQLARTKFPINYCLSNIILYEQNVKIHWSLWASAACKLVAHMKFWWTWATGQALMSSSVICWQCSKFIHPHSMALNGH